MDTLIRLRFRPQNTIWSTTLTIVAFALIFAAGCAGRPTTANLQPPPPPATSNLALDFPEARPTAQDTPVATRVPTTTPAPSKTPTPIPPSTTPRPTNEPAVTAAPVESGAGQSGCFIEYVVIISVDGLRPDAILQTDTPILDGLIGRGAYTDQARAVLPSVTLVNHAS
ncbi:MAG: alkaline phosphatase family protein, partial [Anaerolineae bacterium]|nr:alkaline phosphatase family protein [Anaerolineae bacterium]